MVTRVRNMQYHIYFRIDSVRQANLWFRLENNDSMRRPIQLRMLDENSPKEAIVALGGTVSEPAPEEQQPMADAGKDVEKSQPLVEKAASDGEAVSEGSSIKRVLLWLLVLAAIGLGCYLFYRERHKTIQTEPLMGVPIVDQTVKIVEKRVEVPVEKIVEKIVEKPVEKIVEKTVEVRIDPNPELQKQIESLRTVVQQKQNELVQMQGDLETERRSHLTDVETAVSAGKQLLANAEADYAQKLQSVKDDAARALAQVQNELTTVRQDTSAKLASLQQQTEVEVMAAKQQAAADVTKVQQQAAAEIAAARQQASEQAEASVLAARQQAEEAIETAKQQSAAEVEAVQKQMQQVTEQATAEIATVRAHAEYLNEQLQLPLQISRNALQASLAHIEEHVMLMKEGVEAYNADNNYHMLTLHLAQKFVSFMSWFDRSILQGEEPDSKTVDGLYNLMQENMRQALENNYSWIAELLRLNAYSAISPDFLAEVKRTGIPVDSLKVAASETIALLGRYGITLIQPNLFVDDFNSDNFKLNNAPLINSFYPRGFKEQEVAKRGVIYDMIRAGYAINGQVQRVPEVSAMMAVAQ